MSAIAFEALDYSEDWIGYPHEETVDVEQAESQLLRDMSCSVAVRNNPNLTDIPETVPSDMDELFGFVESRDFEDIKRSVKKHVHRESVRRQLGVAAIGMQESNATLFNVAGFNGNAVAMHLLSALSLERFGSVNSSKIYDLDELDPFGVDPEDPIEQDLLVLRCLVSAVCDIDSGKYATESEAARALGLK